SGGPPMSGGIYAMVFRTNKTGLSNASGVTVSGLTGGETASYFVAAQNGRTDVMPGATITGANGTALITNASISKGLAYRGPAVPALPAGCKFSTHAGASLPFILFIQVVRQVDKVGETCPL